MDWKEFFTINKKKLLIRFIIVLTLFLLLYLVVARFTLGPYSGTPFPESYYLRLAFETLMYFYIPIECVIFLIRLYLFLEFKPKKYIAIAYLLLFIASNIVGFGTTTGTYHTYDKYYPIALLLFFVFFIGLIISSVSEYIKSRHKYTQKK